MKNRKTYWILGILAAALLILMLVWLAGSGQHKNGSQGMENQNGDSNAHTEHSSVSQTEQNGTETTTDPLKQYLSEQDAIMADMMQQMEITPSGNAAIDFLRGMIPHHESAVDMAESYLNYGGGNTELKEMAENIIRTQTEEIAQMNDLIQEIASSGETDEEQETAYLNGYQKMLSGHAHMNHGSAEPKDVEQAFAEGMLMHHEMAVDMSKAILDYTEHKEVRDLAEAIIKAQEDEIDLMHKILEGQKV